MYNHTVYERAVLFVMGPNTHRILYKIYVVIERLNIIYILSDYFFPFFKACIPVVCSHYCIAASDSLGNEFLQ